MSGNVTNPVLSLEVQDSVSPGARSAADALNKLSDVAVTTETSLGKVSATASSLVNRFDPATKSANALERAQRALADANETLARSVAAGDITQTQASNTLTTLQQRVRSLSDAHDNGLTPALQRSSLTMGQILPQFIQFGTSLQGGISPLTAFTQQGHQLADQMLVTGTSVSQLAGLVGNGLRTALAAILSPIGLAVTGAALLGGGLYVVGSAAFSVQSRFGDLRQGLQAYGQDASTVIGVSNDLAKSTSLTRAELDDLGKSLSTGIQNFQATGAQLKNLEILTRDFGAATGQSLQQAAAGIQAAYGDPSREALKLMQDGVIGFTGVLVANVTALQNQGNTAAATNLVLATLGKATKDAAQPTTDFGRAWQALKTAVDGGSGSLTDSLAKLGTPLITVLTAATKGVADLVDAINKLPTASSKLGALFPQFFGAAGVGSLTGSVLSAAGVPNTGANNDAAVARFFRGNTTPTPPGSIAPQLQAAASAYGIDPALLYRLQAAEGVQNADGSWQSSSTGATGPMQVTGTTFRGIASQPGTFNALGLTNNNDVNQNITAGAALFAHLLNKYNDPAVAVLAYHDGESVIDTMLAGNGLASPAAIAEANKVTSGYSGTGRVAVGTGTTPIDVSGGSLPTAGPSPADKGLLDSSQASTYANDISKAATTVNDLIAAEAQLKAANQTSGPVWDSLEQRIQAARQQLEATLPALQAITQPIDISTAGINAEASAWANGAAAANRATIQQQAYTDARKIASTTDAQFGNIQADIASHLLAQAQAQATLAAAQETSKNADQLTFLNTEVATLGQDYDTRQKIIAALQEKQALEQSGKQYTDAQKQALIDQKVALTGVTDQLQLMQSSLQEIGNFGVQVFDQVGSAITNAFISGQGAAINFGSILKSVAGIALQELGKLAIGNVISNAVAGTNLPTVGSVLSALGGGGSSNTTTGGSGGLSSLSSLFQLGSTGNTLLGSPISLSSVGDYFGLGGASGGITGLLNTPLIGAPLSGAGAVYGPVTSGLAANGAGLGTTTLGGALGALGGVTAGYGVGSLAGGYVQSALGKTGPAPQIGAAAGALAGAAGVILAPETFGLSIPIAALLGGAIGGVGGGLIGPHAASEFSSIGLSTTPGGLLTTGQPIGQLDQNLGQEAQAAASQASTLNNLLIQSGISLSSLGGLREIGTNNRPLTPTEALTKTADLTTAFPSFRFNVNDTSTDEGRALAGQVNGQSFASEDQLQSVFTEVDTFINQTLPALTAQKTNVGSFQATLTGLAGTFGPAIDEANKLGVGVDALTGAYQKQIGAAQAAVATQVANDQTGFQASYLAAKAQVTGSPADQQNAALYSFDNVTATQQRQQLAQEYQGIFGDAYTSQAEYVQTSAALERSLAEQRLAIQTQFNSQSTQAATQAVSATVTSLQSYIQKLQGPDSSPLSASGQYSLAKSQFQAVSGAAAAGDYNSISNLSTYADALLSASRNVNGSGTGYVSDYNSVLSSVSSVVRLGADTLTQAFMAAQMQSQTAAIVTAIQSLQNQVAGLQTALTQATNAPARIAA